MKRLSKLTQEAKTEARRAARFIERHGVGSLPGKRSETGESSGRQSLGHGGDSTVGDRQADDGGLGRKHRDPVSYDSMGGLAHYEDWLLDSNIGYLPLVGTDAPPPTVEDMERRARMHHVFSYLKAEHVFVLERKHLERMTLQEIADEDGVSRQAIHKRLKKAEDAFRVAFVTHWNDEVPLGEGL